MPPLDQLDNLVLRLIADGRDPGLLWQAAVVLVSAALAWLAVRRINPYLDRESGRWAQGRHALREVGFQLVMLLSLLAGQGLARFELPHTHLLDLAVPLVLALLVARAVVHALRYVFLAEARWRFWSRLAGWLIWGAFALHITGIGPHLHAWMQSLSFKVGTNQISLWTASQGVFVVVMAVIGALALARFIDNRLLGLTDVNLSLRMALAKAARTVLLIVAVLIALPAVGIDLTVLSVFGGALGVGLGFGLQKVASNYISGFIILLDRSVRIGDLVTVDNKYGEVSQINTRYTLLRALDGTESIVPNETLITQTVVNHSLSEPNVRVTVSVGVAYGADLERARGLMLDAAAAHERVIHDDAESPPRVFLKEFGDSAIVLELAVWIRDASEGQNNLKSDLNWAIWRSFKHAGIEIPFPQRVVHLHPAQP